MAEAVAGLVAAFALYALGGGAFLFLERRLIRSLPSEWREHPGFQEPAHAVETASMRVVLTRPYRRARLWALGLAAGSFVLLAFDATVAFLVVWAGAIAAWWTAAEYMRVKSQRDALMAADPALPAPHLGTGSRFLRWLARWVMWLGLLTMPVFAAAVVHELL